MSRASVALSPRAAPAVRGPSPAAESAQPPSRRWRSMLTTTRSASASTRPAFSRRRGPGGPRPTQEGIANEPARSLTRRTAQPMGFTHGSLALSPLARHGCLHLVGLHRRRSHPDERRSRHQPLVSRRRHHLRMDRRGPNRGPAIRRRRHNRFNVYFDGSVTTSNDVGFWNGSCLQMGGEVYSPAASASTFSMTSQGVCDTGSLESCGSGQTGIVTDTSLLNGVSYSDSEWSWNTTSWAVDLLPSA